MLTEDQNTGNPTETTEPPETTTPPSTEPSSSTSPEVEVTPETESTEIQHDATPINTVGAALDAFKRAAGDQPAAGMPGAQPPFQRQPRDYSGLSEEEVRIFKKVGDRSYDVLKPIYLEHKKFKAEIEQLRKEKEEASKATFFDHEEAYQLTPEYRQASANLEHIDSEVQHWQEQLVKIRQGEKWAPLVRNAQGQIVVGAEQDPTPNGEATIINALMQGHTIKNDLNSKIEGIRNNFSTQHKGFATKMAEIEGEIFKGADQKALDEAMKRKLPLFPNYLHGRQEVRTLAKALALIDGLLVMLNEARTTAGSNTIKARTAANAGPKEKLLAPTVQKGKTVGSVMAEFEKARAMGQA